MPESARQRRRLTSPPCRRVPHLEALVGFSFDHHAGNPDFVRLVMVENIHHAMHLKKSQRIAALNNSALDMIGDIYRRGVEAGDFRPGLDPMDIHLTISALSFYNISNQASIRQVFGCDMAEPERRSRRRASVIELVRRFVLARA